MKVLLQRFDATAYCTRSRLFVDTAPQCVFLELPLKPLVPGGLFAIPAGTYQLIVNQSTRFSALAGHPVYLPLLLDLPGHTTLFHGRPLNDCGIRQHGGNVVNSIPQGQPGGPQPGPYNVNDPHRTDSIGCQLAGTAFGSDHRSTVSSRAALGPYQALLQAAQDRGEAITLTVV
jgi:hypothetical protein